MGKGDLSTPAHLGAAVRDRDKTITCRAAPLRLGEVHYYKLTKLVIHGDKHTGLLAGLLAGSVKLSSGKRTLSALETGFRCAVSQRDRG